MASTAHRERSDETYDKWQEIEGRVRDRWSEITNEDLESARGSIEELIGIIQEKTGDARQQVESFIRQLTEDVAVKLEEMKHAVGERAETTSDQLRQGYEKATTELHHGFVQARETVRRKPTQSVALAFGAGILAGVVVSLACRPK